MVENSNWTVVITICKKFLVNIEFLFVNKKGMKKAKITLLY